MTESLLRTLLDLGHKTSENLNFAYNNSAINFGEETITETNLLEIRRRHPSQVIIRTFPKAQESSQTGADWEWHIVGVRHTLKMRIQAKRVNKHGTIRELEKRSNKATSTQIDLLIKDATSHNMIPAYCFYSAEYQRKFWKKGNAHFSGKPFEFGCLLSHAEDVRNIMPKKIISIERNAFPWHYLWSKRIFEFSSAPYIVRLADYEDYRAIDQVWSPSPMRGMPDTLRRFPTVTELNESDNMTGTGVFSTAEVYPEESTASRVPPGNGIALLMVVDVRAADPMMRHFEPSPRERE